MGFPMETCDLCEKYRELAWCDAFGGALCNDCETKYEAGLIEALEAVDPEAPGLEEEPEPVPDEAPAIRYRSKSAVHHGWLIKTGTKWLHLRLIGDRGIRRVPLSEGRYVTTLTTLRERNAEFRADPAGHYAAAKRRRRTVTQAA